MASASSLIFLATIALARTVPVIDARPNDSSDPASCYRWFPIGTSTTGFQRVCTGTFAVDIPLPVDTAGDKNILVWGSRPRTTSQLSCNAWAVTAQGGYTPGPVVDLTTTSSSFQSITLPTINVPVGGSLWVRCLMSQNVRLMSIDLVNP